MNVPRFSSVLRFNILGLIIDASRVSDTGTLSLALVKLLLGNGCFKSSKDVARVALVGVHKVVRLRCASEINPI